MQGEAVLPARSGSRRRKAVKSAEEIRYAMETYADMVRRICFVQLKNRDDTEDVFQNVYMKYIWNFWNTMKALRFRDRKSVV